MKDPDTVKVDKEVEQRTALVVRFDEDLVPVDLVELHEALSGGDVDETSL